MISKSTFYQILFILTCFHCSWSQTLFQENMGSPTSTTNITGNVFENTTSLSYSNGEQSNSADVRITNASTGYSGASSGGNIFFSSTAGAYGFSIEGINASSYTSLSLQFGYRKESSTSHALFSVDYWNGSAWVVLANSETDLFNESASASAKWYLSKVLTLPLEARINGLKIRFVKTGNKAIRIDDVLLTANGTPIDTPSSSSDVVFNPSSSTSSNTNINYLNYQADVITSTTNSVGVMGFYLRDGGVSLNDTDSLATELTEITFNVTNSTNIRSARLFVGNSPRGVNVPVNGASTISFTGLTNMTAADNDQLAINLRVTFNEVVTDNEQVQFTVSSATASSTGSQFSITNAGGASSSISGDINRIEVTASKLEFSQQPLNVFYTDFNMYPAPIVSALDENENLDLDYSEIVSITSSGTLTNPQNIAAIDGIATFSHIVHSTSGTGIFLTADSNGLISSLSNSFIIETSAIYHLINNLPGEIPTVYFQNTTCQNNSCNLVINGDFEEFNILPNDISQIQNACGWNGYFTPDYYHSQSPNPNVSIPCNIKGGENVNNNQGNGYAGLYFFINGGEIMVSKLASPLLQGMKYQLSFDVSLAEGNSLFSKSPQAYLSQSLLVPNPYLTITNPQMVLYNNTSTSTLTNGWETLVFDFTAHGGEEYIYLGSFQNTVSQTNTVSTNPNCTYNSGSNYVFPNEQPSYYYLDNIRLIPIANLNLPDTICNTANLSNLASFLSNAPTNGIFTGIGVVENSGIYSFDATIAGVGTHTISYVYTNAMGCPITITDEITVVTDGIIAEFDFLNNLVLCENSTPPVLPTTSDNGITGSWSPSTISTASSGTYTFTPNTGQCGIDTIKSIVINENVTPIFTPVYGCNGVPLNPLPTVSINGITGTWSPAISNQPNTIYTFTPTSGLCANTTTDLTIITASIEAVNDDFSVTPINTLTGGTTPSVFANDTLNGFSINPSEITCSLVNPLSISGATINSLGYISVPPNTTPGTYSLTYQINETSCLLNFDTANVVINVSTPNISNSIRANNIVTDIQLQSTGKIVIAGFFTTYNNINKRNFARLNTDLTLDTTFLGTTPTYEIDGQTYYYPPFGFKIQSDDKIIVFGAGQVSYGGNGNGLGISRLNSDGTYDPSFSTGSGIGLGFGSLISQTNSIVNTCAIQQDGKIILGGEFGSYNGVPANSIIRLNPNGSIDSNFSFPLTKIQFINQIVLQPDGKILVAGILNTDNSQHGINRKNLIRLNQDGSIDSSFNQGYFEPFPQFNVQSVCYQCSKYNILKILVLPLDGKILIAGAFNKYNDIPVNGIVRLETNGEIDPDFNEGESGSDRVVYDLDLENPINSSSNILFCGEFTTYNGASVKKMARMTYNGELDNSFSIGTGTLHSGGSGNGYNYIRALKRQSDGKIIVGGSFTSFNGITAGNITRIQGDNGFQARSSATEYISEPEIDINITSGKIKIYPNPSNGLFNLDLTEEEFDFNIISIYNLLGVSVYSSSIVSNEINQIDLSNLPSGYYIAKITNKDKSIQIKLVKK